MTNLIRIRLKGTDRFVRSSPSYAFACDRTRAARDDDFYTRTRGGHQDAFWYGPENRAKVWTDPSSLARTLSMAAYGGLKWHETTWSAYEVVLPDGSALPLDQWLTEQGLRR